ncbi:hypothetical protein [Microbacterium sp. USHLN186]|uniref:hypothetical protein n=1 Tax=Microbacterium sp. USHLN186 TaxID=3081286 RepID=UPI003018FA41
MPKPEYYIPTDEDMDMVGDISYELEQMRLAQTAGAELGWDDPRSWLLAEAGLIHARALMEFLFYPSLQPRERQTALSRATWYTTRAWRPSERRLEFESRIGMSVTDVKASIDLRICHLSVNRHDVATPNLGRVLEALEYMWELMRAHLRPEWKERFPA